MVFIQHRPNPSREGVIVPTRQHLEEAHTVVEMLGFHIFFSLAQLSCHSSFWMVLSPRVPINNRVGMSPLPDTDGICVIGGEIRVVNHRQCDSKSYPADPRKSDPQLDPPETCPYIHMCHPLDRKPHRCYRRICSKDSLSQYRAYGVNNISHLFHSLLDFSIQRPAEYEAMSLQPGLLPRTSGMVGTLRIPERKTFFSDNDLVTCSCLELFAQLILRKNNMPDWPYSLS